MSKGLIFVDLDSTLSNSLQRHHLIAEDWSKTDWEAYALAAEHDEVFEGVAQTVRLLFAAGHTVVIVSGRSIAGYEVTRNWLKANNIPYDQLHLRDKEDHRPNEEYKVDVMQYHLRDTGREAPTLVIDDWPPLAPEMEKLGWPLLLVNPNYPVPHYVNEAIEAIDGFVHASTSPGNAFREAWNAVTKYIRRAEGGA